MMIQLLQANPRGSGLPLAAVLPTRGRKVNGQVLRLPAAPLACCLTHEESNSLEANEPLAWEQRAKPLNHTIPDGNLETAPGDRSMANVPLYTASLPCSLHSR